jgi:hypothetical protein
MLEMKPIQLELLPSYALVMPPNLNSKSPFTKLKGVISYY